VRVAILVTGGAGFIGSSLIEALLAKGREVVSLDNKLETPNLQAVLPRIDHVRGDIRKRRTAARIAQDHRLDGIVHLAAVSRPVWAEHTPHICLEINVEGTANLLEEIGNSGQKPWVIFASSCDVYGTRVRFPLAAGEPIKPDTVFGRSKLAGEEIIAHRAAVQNLRAFILRLPSVYGNEKDILDRAVPAFVLAALRGQPLDLHGGGQVTEFLHIQDVITAVFRTIERLEWDQRRPFVETVDLLSGRTSALGAIIEIISQTLGRPLDVRSLPARPGNIPHFIGDARRAREILDFRPEILPEQGIPAMIELYRRVFGL
jgi:nucleoside-diphosphate-sugar epimerase